MKVLTLNNHVDVPQLGFGVFQITDEEECKRSVLTALRTGYRLIDTAACYGNERAVGEAVKESGIARENVFLTSKVWIQDAGYEKTMRSFEKNAGEPADRLSGSVLDPHALRGLLRELEGHGGAVQKRKDPGHWSLQF